MKKATCTVGILFVLTCVAFGGGSEGSPGVTDDEILIGNIQDLSGPMAYLGGEIKHGAELYLRHVNESGGVYGRKIRMITEDHQYNPAMSLAAAKKLLDRDGVFCLFNVIGTATASALFNLVEEQGVPFIAPATNASSMSDPPKRYVFATDTPYDAQGRILCNYLAQRGDENVKVGIIYQDDDFGKDGLKGVRRYSPTLGVRWSRTVPAWQCAVVRTAFDQFEE